MIRTSLHGRNARGRAAETAARPPTRTKSSISVVTNKTLKKCPRTKPIHPMQEWFQFHFAFKKCERQAAVVGGLGTRCRENAFPGIAAQSRVRPRPKVCRPEEFGMTIAENDEGILTKSFGGL